MYTSFLRRNKYKKNETKPPNERSISKHQSALHVSLSSSISSATSGNFSRSKSQPPIHSAPYFAVPPSRASYLTEHPSALPHRTPHSINSPSQNTGNYPLYPYLGSNQRLSSPAQIDERLRAVAEQYGICNTLSQRLSMLRQFDIVVLCDDSGSMNTRVGGTHVTRWDQLRKIVQIIIEISVVLDSNGIDVHFLNRDPLLHVTDFWHIQKVFEERPTGATPLKPALQRIFRSAPRESGRDKHLLVFVATDGEPTDWNGNVNIRSLERLMYIERQSNTMHVGFLTCTEDKQSVAYLSEWNRTMINVNVIDDYETERKEVRRMRGHQYPFSFGDYIAKALLGTVDPQMDLLDEPANKSYSHK